jgi:undecaprenyl-diphosphatase
MPTAQRGASKYPFQIQHMLASKHRIWLPVGILCATTLILFVFDRQISTFVQQYITPEIKSAASLFSDAGVVFLYIVFAILLIYSFFKKNQRQKEVIWAYLKTQIIFSFLTVRILKICLGRARPKYGSDFTLFSLDADYNSFPSGHSADAFVSGIFLFYLLKYSRFSKYRYIPLLLALLIALSRVAGNSHFASDVVAGSAIGIFGAHYFISKLPEQPYKR